MMHNPLMKNFCKELKFIILTEFHSSLNNIDKIRLLLQKQRLLSYSFDQDIEGLKYKKFLQTQRDFDKRIKNCNTLLIYYQFFTNLLL